MRNIFTVAAILATLSAFSQNILLNDGFESYAAFSQSGLISGGYTVKSITGFQIYNSAHAHYSNRAAVTQITSTKQKDTLTTPAIGSISGTTVLSFYFRIANTGGLYPLRYALGANEKVDVIASTVSTSTLIGTISSSTQNANDTFIKFRVALGQFAGVPCKFSIAAIGNSTSDFFLDVDSLLLIDTVAGTVPVSVTGNVNNVKCHGENTGSITLNPAGGNGSYTYNWGGGIVTKDRNGLTAGSYAVTVSDGLGSSTTAAFNISEPAVLSAVLSASASSGSNGTATVSASGGLPPYTYSWNVNPVQDSSTIKNLAPGVYHVQITDSNHCSIADSVTVPLINGVADMNADFIRIISNPIHDVLTIGLPDGSSGKWAVTDVFGNLVSVNNFIDTDKIKISVGDLPAACYWLRISTESYTQEKRFLKEQ